MRVEGRKKDKECESLRLRDRQRERGRERERERGRERERVREGEKERVIDVCRHALFTSRAGGSVHDQ